ARLQKEQVEEILGAGPVASVNGKTGVVEGLATQESVDQVTAQLADTEGVINVKAHGAKGDGVTDDWQAIQSAITLAENARKSVYFPSGKYFVSKTLRTKHMRTYNYSEGV